MEKERVLPLSLGRGRVKGGEATGEKKNPIQTIQGHCVKALNTCPSCRRVVL